MKLTKDRFDSDYEKVILDVIFSHHKKYDTPILLGQIHDGVYRYYDASRISVTKKVDLMVDKKITETKVKGKRSFVMTDEELSIQYKKDPSLIFTGYGLEEECQRLDENIVEAIKKIMRYNHEIYFKTPMHSNDNAIKLISAKYSKITIEINRKKQNKKIKSDYVRGRFNNLIKKGLIMKGSRMSCGNTGYVIKDYYLEIDREVSKKYG